MKDHTTPRGATTNRRGNVHFSLAFAMAGAITAILLMLLAALPTTTQAAPPSPGGTSVLFQQADPTSVLPTAQTDVTNQQGGTEQDQPLNGGSTENDSNSGSTSNSNNNDQNPPENNQQSGSTQGGNPAGNTGGTDGTGNPFSWWLVIIPIAIIAIAIPFLRRRPANDPTVSSPAPDLERRDQR